MLFGLAKKKFTKKYMRDYRIIRETKMKDIESTTEIPMAAHCHLLIQLSSLFYKIFHIFIGLRKEWNTVANGTKHSCMGENVQRNCSITLTWEVELYKWAEVGRQSSKLRISGASREHR